MTVLAIFKYEVKPGRFDDFMAKLQAAADPRFNSPVMSQSVRLFRRTVPGPETGPVILVIEYPDMAAYGARTAFEKRQSGVEGTIRRAAGFTRDIAVCRVADKLRANFVIAPPSFPPPSGG
jgi:hypothetical protein